MKITQRGPADTDLSQLVHNDKAVGQKQAREVKTQQAGDSAKVNISPEARELQRIAEFARTGNDLRAEKVRLIKEQVQAGGYKVAPEDVAKSILRAEVTRLLKD
ncbi:MAG TPA: flagellar biosynthesis anti-sigma factor FlgM [Candidatus Binatia bacterium]|jgi:flagellar biosynthesis anti-sigma factor FlgM